jgi:hypothetical protein
MKCEFPDAPVTVTLTGQEWTAILIRLAHGKAALSDTGFETYGAAARELAEQVANASDLMHKGVQPGPRLAVAN